MRSFIRFNGQETSVENMLVIDNKFNAVIIEELRRVFGAHANFAITPTANFIDEAQTDNIFNGVITGKYEGECPVAIKVFTTPLEKPINDLEESEEPEPQMVVPAFLGFRK